MAATVGRSWAGNLLTLIVNVGRRRTTQDPRHADCLSASNLSMLEIKEWFERKLELFRKRPYYLTGCD